MNTSRERDDSVERLLRQSLQAARNTEGTDLCLDAETLAAWVDGGLSGRALEMAHSHVADCDRCQSLVGAIARANGVVPQAEPERARRRWLQWLVPLTAAAAAVTLWVAGPRDSSSPAVPQRPAAEAQTQTKDADATPLRSLADQPQTPAVGAETREAEAAGKVDRQAAVSEFRKDARLESDRLNRQDAASAPAAAPSAAPLGVQQERPLEAKAEQAARSAAGLAETVGIEIVSPDPSVRWRVSRSVVERSTDGGSSWNAVPTGIATELSAGAAPSTSVCWVVGRGGVVLLTIDGRSWRRVAFPDATDLSAVQATDARTASVSTADGRTYGTSDGGITWDRR